MNDRKREREEEDGGEERPWKGKRRFQGKKKKKFGLENGPIVGTCGLFVSCDIDRERECAAELLEYLSALIPDEFPDATQEPPSIAADTAAPVTVEEALRREREEMDGETETGDGGRGRQVVSALRTGVRGTLYIRVNEPRISPTALALAMARRVRNPQPTDIHLRRTVRALPVERTCHAHIADFSSMARPMLERAFGTGGCAERAVSWRVEFRSRNNNSMGKDEVLDAAKAVVSTMPPPRILKWRDCDAVVVVEAFCGVVGVSVVAGFDSPEIRGFNLRALAENRTGVTPQYKQALPTTMQEQQSTATSSVTLIPTAEAAATDGVAAAAAAAALPMPEQSSTAKWQCMVL